VYFDLGENEADSEEKTAIVFHEISVHLLFPYSSSLFLFSVINRRCNIV